MASSCDLFVPGRVCLLGEHSDWAASYRNSPASPPSPDILPGRCLVYATDCGIYARATKVPVSEGAGGGSDGGEPPMLEFVAQTPGGLDGDGKEVHSFSISMGTAALAAKARRGGFFSYVCGVALVILERCFAGDARRMNCASIAINNYRTDLPIKKGLSSSAAVCVLVARVFDALFGLHLSTDDVMDIAFAGELRTPSQCGRMDQCVAFGPGCVRMDIDGDAVSGAPVLLPPGAAFYFVVADMRAQKDTQTILRDLNACYPEPRTPIHDAVQRFLGPITHELVDAAEQCLRRGDAAGLGRVLSEAQRLFDEHVQPASPAELTAPTLHRLLVDPAIAELTFGGKGVGSQGDGSVQFVAKSREDQLMLCELLSAAPHSCLPFAFTLTSTL